MAFATDRLLQLRHFGLGLRRALPPAVGSHLVTSSRAGLLGIVEGLVLLEDVVLGHEDTARCRCNGVSVGYGTQVVSDQTRRFTL